MRIGSEVPAYAFLTFLRKAVKPHTGKEIHVVLDSLSTHDTPEVRAWLARNPERHLPHHPGRIELAQPDRNLVRHRHLAGHLPRQLRLRHSLIGHIRAYVEHWNADAEPFVWTATADEVLARVRWVETNVKKLIANNTSNGYGITEH